MGERGRRWGRKDSGQACLLQIQRGHQQCRRTGGCVPQFNIFIQIEKKKKSSSYFKLLSFCSNLFSYSVIFKKGIIFYLGTDVYTAAVSSMTSSGNKQYYYPNYGNLDYTSSSQGSRSWSPYYNNPSQYLEFQLSTQYFVTGFDTKGDVYSYSWVTKIKLLFYNDTSSTWVCTLTVYSISFKYYMYTSI